MKSAEVALRHHEAIEITEQPSPRKKLIRQDRIPVHGEKCFIFINGVGLKVINYSSFGLAALSTVPLEHGTEYQSVSFVYDGYEVGTYHLKLVRQFEEGGRAAIAFEIVSEPLDMVLIQAIDKGLELITSHRMEREEELHVPPLFKQKILEVKDWLETLQSNCEQLEESFDWENSDINRIQESISQFIGSWLGTEFPKIHSTLASELGSLDEGKIRKSMDYFRRKLKHLVYKSPMAERAYRKPLGYAGDFQMMNIIYDNQSAGDTLFAKCMHRYFISETASKAVRNRAHYLKAKILSVLSETNSQRTKRVLSVASGPAREIEMLINDSPTLKEMEVNFQLLDQDATALQHAQNRLLTAARKVKRDFNLQFLHLAIKNIIGRGLPEKDYDLIYSAGLFDYFSDPVAMVASERLYAALRPGGTLIIGNFDVKNPSQAVMELVLDWELIYRSKEQLLRLYGNLGAEVTVEEEPEKVNLFCVIRKPLSIKALS